MNSHNFALNQGDLFPIHRLVLSLRCSCQWFLLAMLVSHSYLSHRLAVWEKDKKLSFRVQILAEIFMRFYLHECIIGNFSFLKLQATFLWCLNFNFFTTNKIFLNIFKKKVQSAAHIQIYFSSLYLVQV